MNKSEYIYNSISQFETEKESLDSKRHYTAETLDDKNIHFKNYNIKPEDFIKPISASTAADICLVENNTLEKYIVDANNYDINIFPSEQYTPIGVVVVPASHTDDGTARVISLASMDYNNPDPGNTQGHINMYWGYIDDVPDLPYLTYAPYIAERADTITAETQTLLGFDTPIYQSILCSDYYTSYQNPYDTKSYYGSSRRNYKAMPSPYLEDGNKNPIYHNTSNTGNVLADIDGKSNTEKILAVDNSGSTDWQTAATITNTGYTGTIHPAAQCCWRYHTIGTSQGDWYLPAGGELGYLASRWKAINASIQKVISSGFQALPVVTYLWSSTEYSYSDAVCLSVFNDSALLENTNKNIMNLLYVRAFLAV